MMSNWIETNLKEICDISIGRTPPRKEHKWFSETKGIPWISIADMGKTGKYISKTKEYLSEEAVKKFKIPIIKKDTIILSFKMTVGRVSITESEMLSNEAIAHLNNCKIETEFLYYYLRQFNFSSLSSTSSIVKSAVNSKILKEIPVLFPEKRETQRKIANFISQFDEKIELNQKMNETLEEITKTLFKSWFIDFDPVRAKAEGRPTGLSNEISDLFPDSFEDSEFGEIPKGWEVKALDEIAEFLNGLALQKYPEDEECLRYPVLKIAQLREGSTKNQNVFSSNIPDKYIVRNGDYIFSWSGSLLAKFWLGGDAALNQHLFKVTSQNYPKWFFAGWVENHLDMFSSIASSKATTMGHIKRSDLKDAKTVVPPIELISSFGEYFSPLREKANLCLLENNILSELRDTLLPKLISGELKISDTESLIEEVGV